MDNKIGLSIGLILILLTSGCISGGDTGTQESEIQIVEKTAKEMAACIPDAPAGWSKREEARSGDLNMKDSITTGQLKSTYTLTE